LRAKPSITLKLYLDELSRTDQKSQIEPEIANLVFGKKQEIDPRFLTMMRNTIRAMHLQALQNLLPAHEIAARTDSELGIVQLYAFVSVFLRLLLKLSFDQMDTFCRTSLNAVECFTGVPMDIGSKSVLEIPVSLEGKFEAQLRYCELTILPKVNALGQQMISTTLRDDNAKL
jgi:hypothetical protein